jgi:alanyl-tRNA synthetase
MTEHAERTVRLFDRDSHLFTFTARVLSCTPGQTAGTYALILDRTAFFPEGGGQAADAGWIHGIPVLDVQVSADGVITHTVSKAIPVGSVADGQVCVETRLRRMRCHTGEHILSGLIHGKYGFDNVGFHLGEEDVTMDFNGVLTRPQLDDMEDAANRVVRDCLPVQAVYPSPEELASMTYRSKRVLDGPVRIVTVGCDDHIIDRCACCAPHVDNTGEIGLIKILDATHYKGGVRLHMLAGAPALEDYRRRYAAVAAIAADLSVKQADVMEGYARMKAELEEAGQALSTLRRELWDSRAAALPRTEGSICLFDQGMDSLAMRQLLNRVVGKCGLLCGIFSGDDASGYTYVIGRGSDALDLKRYAPALQAALSARGGGSSDMLQGRATASRTAIQAFFDSFRPSDTPSGQKS